MGTATATAPLETAEPAPVRPKRPVPARGLAAPNRRGSAVFLRSRARKALAALESRRRALRDAPRSASALHDYRKQARRLAATVLPLELYLNPTDFAAAMQLTADLAQGLGRYRDADVLRRRVRRLRKQAAGPVRDDLRAVEKELRIPKRRRAVRRACRRSGRKRLRAPLTALLGRVRPRPGDAFALLEERVRRRGQAALSGGGELADLHAFRLELKVLRYALEALEPRAKTREGRLAAQCRPLTDLLGRIVDARALEAIARGRSSPAADALLDAARSDAASARQGFEAGWEAGRWADVRSLVESA